MKREERLKKISMIVDELEGHHGIRLLIPDLEVSENLKYHINNNIKLASNVFRIHSKSYLDLFNEARALWKEGALEVCDADAWLLQTDIGKTAMIGGVEVPLDLPMEIDDDELLQFKMAAEKKKSVKLNSPRRIGKGDPGHGKKKFIVHVRNPETGGIKTITFGDANLSIKANNPERRKSFLARHNCDSPGPKTKAKYWSCNIHRYKKQLGLKFEGRW